MTQDKSIDLIGFPMDLGANRRGVDMGPSALRIAGMAPRLERLGYQVTDRGDIAVATKERQEIVNKQLKYAEEIVRAASLLAAEVQRSLEAGHFPLSIGGDHSLALGSIAGVAAHCQRRGHSLGVIWIDAHADMNTDETSPSGNIHGMALAASLGIGPAELTMLGGLSPKVRADHCAILGVRSVDGPERRNVQAAKGLRVVTMTEIDRRGMNAVLADVLESQVGQAQHIHVSLDVDAVDPSVARGVGTPVPGGLTYREAHLLMETIAESGRMCSLDVVEVNPILDHENGSAQLAAELVASVMGERIL
jgi:arginase